jgi:hypothetical protein
MKPTKTNKRNSLSISKRTITRLQANEMVAVKGGTNLTVAQATKVITDVITTVSQPIKCGSQQ